MRAEVAIHDTRFGRRGHPGRSHRMRGILVERFECGIGQQRAVQSSNSLLLDPVCEETMEAPVGAHGISAHAPVEAKPAAAHSIAFLSERQAAVLLWHWFELLHHHETLELVRPATKP